jgi:hypothetical protein
MNELIQLALSTKVTLDFLESELEKVCKNKALPLRDRYEALRTLGNVGRGHSDWWYHGWDKLDAEEILRDLWSDRHQRHNLLEVLENTIEDWHKDPDFINEKLEEYYASLPEGTCGSALDFLLFDLQDLQTIEFVECLCDDATFSFTYDW